jgi:DNA-binding GntR family transcriptional regulator
MAEAFQRPPTAQLAVLAELRRRIVRGELEPGASIRQEALARELGVSRLPVREALMVLRAEKLVDYVQHKGYVTSSLDIEDLNQTYHLRGILETEAVRQAMPNLTDEHIDQMRESMRLMETAQDDSVTDLLEENRRFHFILFAASHNMRLDTLLRQLWNSCDRYRALYYAEPEDLARVLEEHRELVRACESRSSEQVIHLLSEHRQGGLEAMRQIFSARKPTAPE